MHLKNSFIIVMGFSMTILQTFACMYEPAKGMKITFTNNSNDLATITYADQNDNNDDHKVYREILNPGQKFPADPHHYSFPTLKNVYTRPTIISNKAGTFSVAWSSLEHCVVLSEIKPVATQTGWQKELSYLQKLPVVCAALAIIQSNGRVKMLPEISKPTDGRPDVDLLLYQKIGDFTSYLTAEQLLFVGPKETKEVIKERYEQLLKKWRPADPTDFHAIEATELISWAYAKLINK